ncbi:MAG: AAA family ATPase [Byssovorax sp.]
MSSPPISQTFRRRYVIQGALGAGGMAAVYQARDRLGGQVALKRLKARGSLVRPGDSEMPSPDAPTPVLASETDLSGPALSDTLAPTAVYDPQGDPSGHEPTVDLSRMPTRPGAAPFSESGMALRLALTQEFRTLSTVRHPNIIGVLDYGFDDEGQPYFTMDLLRNPETIYEAGARATTEGKVALIAQMLQALLYIHRRGLVHRDLKPSNVLVHGGEVKVLDFGLAVLVEHVRELGRSIAGTPPYMAPELFLGQPPSEASDLYGVGIIAYEIFTGHNPFHTEVLDVLRQEALVKEPDLSGIDPRIAPVIGRLLAKDPRARYADAALVIAALGAATGQVLSAETPATRESFLKAARLVGRDAEMAMLSGELDGAMKSKGGSFLVGGESGVGKSRLLDELRAHALVNGAAVLRGQEVSEGGSPYQVYRDVLRWLLLLTEPLDDEAAVLKELVPDIETLLEREVPDAPEIAPDAAQDRLVSVVEALLRRLSQPVLIVLEDLHWTPSASLKLLGRITPLLGDLPVLIVATYRDDERPDLPTLLPAMQILKLERLTREGIAVLSESMIGPTGARPELVSRLAKETEGNPFFLVEVVRALAEEVGALARVGQDFLPEIITPQGMATIVARRLGRVPPSARPLLSLAAVAGRQLDLALLGALEKQLDLDEWVSACTAAAVLDAEGGTLRFAHDKLREGLLAQLSPAERRSLHLRVAGGIEVVHPDDPAQTAALAHHYAAGGDDERAAHYAGLAGEQALHSSAYREAIAFFERALTMLPADEEEQAASSRRRSPGDEAAPGLAAMARRLLARGAGVGRAVLAGVPSPRAAGYAEGGSRFRRARWEGQMSEAHGRLGDHVQGMRHSAEALRYLGLPMPEGPVPGVAAVLVEAARCAYRSVRPGAPPAVSSDARTIAAEAARVHTRITETCYYTEDALHLFWSGFRTINLGELSGPSPELSRGYAGMGILAGIMRIPALAEAWLRRALELAERLDKPYDLAWVLARDAVYRITVCDWTRAETELDRALSITRKAGDQRQWEEGMSVLLFALGAQGRFAELFPAGAEVFASAQRRGDEQILFWAAELQAWARLRVGQPGEAAKLLLASLPWIDAQATVFDVISAYGFLALAEAHLGDLARARQHADKALAIITKKTPLAYYTQSPMAAVAEVYHLLHERTPATRSAEREELRSHLKRATKSLSAFGQIFPVGRPSSLLWQGHVKALDGDLRGARAAWERASADALKLRRPYEEAQAELALGRAAGPGGGGRAHLVRALSLFETMGAAPDRDATRAELDRLG